MPITVTRREGATASAETPQSPPKLSFVLDVSRAVIDARVDGRRSAWRLMGWAGTYQIQREVREGRTRTWVTVDHPRTGRVAQVATSQGRPAACRLLAEVYCLANGLESPTPAELRACCDVSGVVLEGDAEPPAPRSRARAALPAVPPRPPKSEPAADDYDNF